MKLEILNLFVLVVIIPCSLCQNLNESSTDDDHKTIVHEFYNLTFTNEKNILLRIDGKLKAEIGKHKLGFPTSYRECKEYYQMSDLDVNDKTEKVICLEDEKTYKKMQMSFEKISEDIKCYDVLWTDMTNLTDCFLMSDAFWYGGSELHNQRWPMSDISVSETPFVTGDYLSWTFFGPVIENLWLTSKGVAIFVDYDTPLTVSVNAKGNKLLCFSADNKAHPYNSLNMKNELKYTICSGRNIREIYTYASNRWIPKQKSIPNADLILEPIWSTWAKYKIKINQSVVLKFAKEISSNGFSGSLLEIDDKWEKCYGDLDFDLQTFPNPRQMVSSIKSLGMQVTVWIHPFINQNCSNFEMYNDYLVRNRTDPKKALLVSWWNGIGGYVDFTNPSARKWFVGKLQFMKDAYGIDGFKWDAGEALWLKEDFVLYDSTIRNPNFISKLYAEMAYTMGGPQEVRVGFNSQSYPLLIRMLDKASNWGYIGGLRTLIPTGLLFSIYGYHIILPDMIGGNNYNSETLPDKELFIRWFQVSIFFPSMQYSIAPWDYDNETLAIIKNGMKLRETFKPLLKNALEKTVEGNLVFSPLWIISPEDVDAQKIDSEFLVDDTLLVAPVLEKNAVARDVYLPDGKWQDLLRGGVKTGPTWLRKYTVLLHEIALFKKVLA